MMADETVFSGHFLCVTGIQKSMIYSIYTLK